MTKPTKTGLITAGAVLAFIIVALTINTATRILEVPVLGRLWSGIMLAVVFPFTAIQPLYRPLAESNPTGATRIMLDLLCFVLPPLFWGAVAFGIQKQIIARTSNKTNGE
jgi:hypothetical protein